MKDQSLDIKNLLQAWSKGDTSARDRLMPMVYDELRKIARTFLRAQYDGHTLQTTALVHEAYIRLVQSPVTEITDRIHFFAFASQLMRAILVDHYRKRQSAKRGGDNLVSLDEALTLSDHDGLKFLSLNDALTKLEAISPRRGRIVELRFFSGMTIEETAIALDVSPKTVQREWSTARAWLRREMNKS